MTLDHYEIVIVGQNVLRNSFRYTLLQLNLIQICKNKPLKDLWHTEKFDNYKRILFIIYNCL